MLSWNTIASFTRITNGVQETITPVFVHLAAVSAQERIRLGSELFMWMVEFPMSSTFTSGPIGQGDKIHWPGVPKGGLPLHTPSPDLSTGYATAYIEQHQ